MKQLVLQLSALAIFAGPIIAAPGPSPSPSPSPSRRLLPASSPASSPALRTSPLPRRSASPAATAVPSATPVVNRTAPPAPRNPAPPGKTTSAGAASKSPSPAQAPGSTKPVPLGPAQVPGSAPLGNVALPPPKPGVLVAKAPPMKIENMRAPIPFVAFEPEDLQTRQKISRSTLMKLPNGRQVEAGKYYDALNKTEQSLNTIGRSLHQEKHITVEIKPTYTKLSATKDHPKADSKSNKFEVSQKMVEKLGEANARFKKANMDALLAKGKNKADDISGINTKAPGPVYDPNKPFPGKRSPAMTLYDQPATLAPQFSAVDPPNSDVFGDPQYAAVTFDVSFTKRMSPLSMYFGVIGKVKVTVLSLALEPTEVRVGLSAPLVGRKGVTGAIKPPYLPMLFFSDPKDASASDAIEVSGEQGADLNKEVRTTVMFGPIPVTFAAGVAGKVGVRYGVTVQAGGSTPAGVAPDGDWLGSADQSTIDKTSYAMTLDGHADAFGDLRMYALVVAGGEIDLGLCTVGASVGIHGAVTVFNGQVSAHATASLIKQPDQKPYGDVMFFADYGVASAMAGQIWLEAELDFCFYSVGYKYFIWDHPGSTKPSTLLFTSNPKGDLF